MNNINMAARSVLIECLEDITINICHDERWLFSFDDLSFDTRKKITWSILSYGDEFDLDELEKSVHSLYEEMMTAREPYEPLEWDYVSVEHLVSMLAGFWREDNE